MSDSATPPIEILLRHRDWLARMAATLVVDVAAADDLAQQTLLAALERPPPRADHPRAWLGSVLRNLARRLGASERSRDDRERAAAQGERLPPTDEVVGRAALQHDVSAAVLALDEPYRTALLLRYFDDLPPRAIAARIGVPVETVRTRVKRGIELVRAELVRRRGPRGEARQWAVALVGLLDAGARRSARRALLAGPAAGGTAAIGAATLMGVIGMSTKLKIGAAALLVAAGTLAVVTLREPADPAAPDPAHAAGRPERPSAPAFTEGAALAEPAAATRTEVEGAPAGTSKAPAPTRAVATCAIEGVVRTSAGVAAEGALVVAELHPRKSGNGTLFQLARDAEGLLQAGVGEDGPARTRAGRDGTFRLDGFESPANVDVAAVHPGLGMAVRAGIALDATKSPLRVEITLVDGVALHGTVTDRDARPLPGAEVGVNVAQRTPGNMVTSSLLTLRTDAEGRYRSLPLPFGDFSLSAESTGYAAAYRDPVTPLPGEREHREDFVLEPAPRLAGAILGPDGAPARLDRVERELVVVGSGRDPAASVSGREGLGPTGTLVRDADRYELVDDWGSIRFVSLWCDDALLGSARVSERGVGPDLTVDLARIPPLPGRGALRVAVRDAADGAALPDFTVKVTRDPHERPDEPARTAHHDARDSDGTLAVEALELGAYEVEVRAEGYAPALAVARVTADPGSSTVEVALARGTLALRGGVVDERGAPVGGAAIALLRADGRPALPFPDYRLVADAEGRFAFTGLPDGAYSIVADTVGETGSHGDGELAPAAVAARAGDDDLRITLRTGVKVRIVPLRAGARFDGGYSLRFCDERGVPVIDQLRAGTRTRIFGSQVGVRLAPGAWTVELFAGNHHGGPVRFLAAPDATVEVELAPVEGR